MSEAIELLASLVLENGARWGEAATPEQWSDARAVLTGAEPYNFLTRSRGFSKTSDLAGLALSMMLAELPAASRLYGLACDRDQAALLVDACLGFSRRTPGLSSLKIEQYRVSETRGGSTLEVMSADASSSYGLKPAFVVVDELAQWGTTGEPKRLFDAVSSAMTKVEGARMVAITSAGDPAHWSYKVLEHARRDPLWRTSEVKGSPPWADPARLAEQKRRLPESVYRRLFLNEWTASEDRLTDIDGLRACVTLDGPQSPKEGVNYVLAVDLGLKNDRTAGVICHAQTVEEKRVIVLDRLQVWKGNRLNPVQLSTVEDWIEEAARKYNRARVRFDPWQSAGMQQRLEARGIFTEEFNFSSGSVGRLASTLHLLIKNRELALPDDPDLLDELANVRLREQSPGVLRLDHDRGRHDDQAIALALAASALVDEGTPAETQTSMDIIRPLKLPGSEFLRVAGRRKIA